MLMYLNIIIVFLRSVRNVENIRIVLDLFSKADLLFMLKICSILKLHRLIATPGQLADSLFRRSPQMYYSKYNVQQCGIMQDNYQSLK